MLQRKTFPLMNVKDIIINNIYYIYNIINKYLFDCLKASVLCSSFAAVRVSLTFNLDLTNLRVYTGERDHFFGYKVLQFMSGTNKG